MNESPARIPRLLLIEDNPGDIELLRFALQEAGITCDIAVLSEGAAAAEHIRRHSGSNGLPTPDLVILDLKLPQVSGRELLSIIRSTDAFSEVPVVVWSSSNAPGDRAHLEEMRIDRYLVKPFDLQAFLNLGHEIKEILTQRA